MQQVRQSEARAFALNFHYLTVLLFFAEITCDIREMSSRTGHFLRFKERVRVKRATGSSPVREGTRARTTTG